ncbi:unnamed protein product [marine sediment metagenome]|uniref:Uncharacterized protein n=1 Tax=marine sediment metagenome TaxID=412755 RepID=X1KW68_9ZZZZ
MAEKLEAPTGTWIKEGVPLDTAVKQSRPAGTAVKADAPTASGILCGSTTICCGALNIGCGGGFWAVKSLVPMGVWTKLDAPT